MGDMADFELESVAGMENLRDDYVSGGMSMQEAYDNGFIDEMGIEQAGIQEAWDRSQIPTVDNINNQLSHAVKDFELATLRKSVANPNMQHIPSVKNPGTPTCNVCHKNMRPRDGEYGKFYYCNCVGQSCVSDKYWQKINGV